MIILISGDCGYDRWIDICIMVVNSLFHEHLISLGFCWQDRFRCCEITMSELGRAAMTDFIDPLSVLEASTHSN